MADGGSHLCQAFTKTNPELLCGRDDCENDGLLLKVQPYACVKG